MKSVRHCPPTGSDAPAGGEKKITAKQPGILDASENLVGPVTRGDPESSLRRTCKSTYRLRDELLLQGYSVSQSRVCKLPAELGYGLRSPRKTGEGGEHPDRDAQFMYIDGQVRRFRDIGLPVISVDTKKKENIGNYANRGREYRPKGRPERVKVYDFVDKTLGKVSPYGIYDISRNEGFVNVGISYDTAEFAVSSIRAWWYEMGQPAYPKATGLLITADGGGSNGSGVRLWKTELQKLADELSLDIHVCHFPPGTGKWNKTEHKMFCHISKNWRGRPLVSRETVVRLISSTTTKAGLRIRARLDENICEKGRKVSDKELATVNIERGKFCGKWNYTIKSNHKIKV